MNNISDSLLEKLQYDFDQREEVLRQIVEERLAENPPPLIDDQLVASYFFSLRTSRLAEAMVSIAYHATSGTKDPPPGSLLDQCTAKPVGIEPFDPGGRLGLIHVAFPLKMMQQPEGHITSVDIMHTVANAVIFDMYENIDCRLVSLGIPDHIIRSFPGPAYGPGGIRERTGFPAGQPAFGTILKPTAGITPDVVEKLVQEAAECPLFLFVKEDENLYPNLDYSPVAERTRRAAEAIRHAKEHSDSADLLFAPHITGTPHELILTVEAVIEAGATAVMLSETFAGGSYRLVREATKHLDVPPALYGHNAGIGAKTRCIWREVIDLLARLDGIDFRQTAPLTFGEPYIKPYRDEWIASEKILSKEIPGINTTTIVRAGGLDQGNIALNLEDADQRGLTTEVLFLAGSAINSIKNDKGEGDPKIGATAMMQALDIHKSGELRDKPKQEHLPLLRSVSVEKGFKELMRALNQRYPNS